MVWSAAGTLLGDSPPETSSSRARLRHPSPCWVSDGRLRRWLDSSGTVVVRKRCSRTQLLTYAPNMRVQVIGMEACSGSHFLWRALRAQGHDVRLVPAQYVKPYIKTNKSDYIDAEAIAEAVQRPTMRFVPIKTEEHLDLQAVHGLRERWVMRRTAVVNQIRGLLLERGLTLPKGRSHVGSCAPRDLNGSRSETVRFVLYAAGSVVGL
jgi:hypothetical protein